MFERTAKLLPATTVALSFWSSPAWAGDHGGAVLNLLYMPGDLFVEAIIWIASTAHMPWLIDALAEATNITNGWFTVCQNTCIRQACFTSRPWVVTARPARLLFPERRKTT